MKTARSRLRWLPAVVLGATASMLLVACNGQHSQVESGVELEILPTNTLVAPGALADEDQYATGMGHAYRVRVRVTYTDSVLDHVDPAETTASVVYYEAGTGAERSAEAARVGSSNEYMLELPSSANLDLCEPMKYAWMVGYVYDTGKHGMTSSDWLEVVPSRRFTPTGLDQLACADVLYQDVDGSSEVATIPISVVRTGGGCEYGLEFNNPDNPPDFALLRVGGSGAPAKHYLHFDPDCDGRPMFTADATVNQAHYDQQTTYYWTLLAREYALEHLWVAPPGWNAGPSYAQESLGPNVLISDEFDRACSGTSGNPTGCFRAWQTGWEGNRMFIKQGGAEAPVILHEFGHYAAGRLFGYSDPISQVFGGDDPVGCQVLGFQETLSEMFMSLVLHDARQWHYASLGPIANGQPRSSFDLEPAAADVWDDDCGNSNYVWGRPLVQAFHELLWVDTPQDFKADVWDDHEEANDALANAFSTALAHHDGFSIQDLAGRILDYLEDQHSGAYPRAAVIFKAHGFLRIGDNCSSDLNCCGSRTGRCDLTAPPTERRCIPDDGWGREGEHCTHIRHCGDGLTCDMASPVANGTCEK